jgi:hypothetical protein
VWHYLPVWALGSLSLALTTLSQTSDPSSLGNGWAGAGLLGLILSWLLLVRLPQQDKLVKELSENYSATVVKLRDLEDKRVESADRRTEAARTEFMNEMRAMRLEFKEILKIQADVGSRDVGTIAGIIRREFDALKKPEFPPKKDL